MADTRTRRIACFCEKVFEAELPTVVDLAARPGAADEVLRGEFMAVSCPACGKRLTPEFPCRFRGVAAGDLGTLELALVPEADRVAWLAGRAARDTAGADRVVIGVSELAEKLLVFRAGLDDRVVEMMKFLLASRPGTVATGAGEVTVTFQRVEGDRLVFHLAGLRPGEVAVARLERSLYDRLHAELPQRLAEDPWKEFCTPPYVSLRRVEQELAE
jgi:hypothetical protein